MEYPILMIERRSLLLGITETQRVVQVNFRSHLKVGLFVGRDLSCRKCLNDGNAFLASLSMFPQFKLSCFEIESLPTSNFKYWEKIWIDIDYRKLGVRMGWTLKVEIRHYWYTAPHYWKVKQNLIVKLLSLSPKTQ